MSKTGRGRRAGLCHHATQQRWWGRDAATHELHDQDAQVALHALLKTLVELRAVPPQLDTSDEAANVRIQGAREEDDDKDAQAG
eukprot:7382759-Prymnesium_polylepis.1